MKKKIKTWLYEFWHGHPFLLEEEVGIICETRDEEKYKWMNDTQIQKLIKIRIKEMYKNKFPKPTTMTTEELIKSHLEKISGVPKRLILLLPEEDSHCKTAKQCAKITLEHTIGVLSNLYKKSSAGNVFADILSEMDELIKQNELL